LLHLAHVNTVAVVDQRFDDHFDSVAHRLSE
jgi:hypothetical protein